jgi:hypothetical protein
MEELSLQTKNNVMIYFLFYGTGSYPLFPQGWQRAILFIANLPPLKIPYFITASIAYCEQVGT